MKKLWPLIPVFVCWFLSMQQHKEMPNFKFISKPSQKEKVVELPKTPDKLELINRLEIRDYHQAQSESFDSPLGKTIVYSFSQDGVPILGMNIRLKEQPDGVLIEEENTYRPIPKVQIQREVLEDQAAQLRENLVRYDLSGLSTDSLVILVREGVSEGELAFSTSATDKAGSTGLTQLVIRSEDGKILRKAFGRKEF